MRSLSRGIGVGLLSSGWLAVLSLVLAPIYVHLLGIESYGLIGLYTAALAIGGILDVALSTTVSREIAWKQARPEEQHEIGPLLRSVEIIYWLVVSVLALILLIADAVFGTGWIRASALPDEQVESALIMMLLSLAIQLPSGLYSASLIGLHRQALSATLLAGFGTLRGVGAALVAWRLSDDIRAFFLWHIVVSLIQVIWLRWQTWSYVKAQGGQPYFAIKFLLSIQQAAGAMFLITVMGMMLSQMDKLILAFIVPLKALGHYTLAWGLASGLSVIATPVAQGFGVRYSALVSKANESGLATNIVIASQLMFVLMIPPAVITSLFSEEIVFLWTRDVSMATEVAKPLVYLLYGTALVGCVYPFLYALYAKRAFKPVLHILVVCLAVLFPLLVCSINEYGITGAAWCWLVYGVVLLVAYSSLTVKIVEYRIEAGKLLGMFVFVSAVSSFIGWVVKELIGSGADSLWLIPILGAAILCACFFALVVCTDLRNKLVST